MANAPREARRQPPSASRRPRGCWPTSLPRLCIILARLPQARIKRALREVGWRLCRLRQRTLEQWLLSTPERVRCGTAVWAERRTAIQRPQCAAIYQCFEMQVSRCLDNRGEVPAGELRRMGDAPGPEAVWPTQDLQAFSSPPVDRLTRRAASQPAGPINQRPRGRIWDLPSL